MRRKLTLICFLFITGIFSAYLHPAVCLFSAAAILILFCLQPFQEAALPAPLRQAAFFAFLAGILVFSVQMKAVRDGEVLNGEERVFQAEVLSASGTESGGTRFLCLLNDEAAEGACRVSRWNPYRRQRVFLYSRQAFSSEAELTGVKIRFTAVLEEPEGRRNPNTFDYRQYLRSRGITHTARTDSIDILQGPETMHARMKRKILCIREIYMENLRMGEEEKRLLAGVLFGNTEAMPEEMKEMFRCNGTAHILAVSGLHVGVIYGLYRKITSRRKWKGSEAVFLAFLCLYGCLTLWTVSVVRAVLLIVFLTLGDRLGRRYDLLTALCFTASLIALKNPCAVLGASFQMSFLAVGSMCFITPVLVRRLPHWIPAGVPAALAVQIGTVPYCAFTFNQAALAALLCNIPVLFLLGFLVPAGIAAIPAVLVLVKVPGSGICAGMLSAVSAVLQLLSRGMLTLNHILSQDGKFCIDVISAPESVLIAGYMILFFCCSEFYQVHRIRGHNQMLRRMLCGILLISMSVGCCRTDDFRKAEVVLVDVGQGDCVHVRGQKQVLLDGGGSVRRDIGKQVLKPYLLKNRCRSIDMAMATHLHADHYLGIQQLAGVYPVRRQVTKGRTGDVYPLGRGDRIEILWPDVQDPLETDENMNSLIFKVYIGGFTMLVTGDLGETGEQKLLEKYRGTDRLRCDVLKVGHHGSRYSSTEEFIDAVRPAVAVIGVGKKNTYGHPSDETLQRFTERNIPVYRTDLDGAVGIWKDRKGRLRVCTVCERPRKGTLFGRIRRNKRKSVNTCKNMHEEKNNNA